MTQPSGPYRLVLRNRAKRQLNRVPRRDREAISENIDGLPATLDHVTA